MQKKNDSLNVVLNELIQIEDMANLRKFMRTKDFSLYSQDEIMAEFNRREALKPKPLTVTQQLQFIMDHQPEEEKYDIEKIYEKSFCHAMKKPCPYTYFSDGYNATLKKYRLIFTNTIEVEAKRFEDYVLSLEISIEDFAAYCQHDSLFSYHFFRPKKDAGKDQFSGGDVANICHFIQYLVTGSLANDYQQTNEFLKEQKIAYNEGAYSYTIGNLSVRKYANGWIDIKGLTASQELIINKMLDIHQKTMHL